MPPNHNITDTVGRSPVILLNRAAAGLPGRIALKSEFKDPLRSVKSRIGRAMIEDAEASGILQPGGHIIEPTSGTTGVAPAFVTAAKGYKITPAMPETIIQERRTLPALLGANLVLAGGAGHERRD